MLHTVKNKAENSDFFGNDFDFTFAGCFIQRELHLRNTGGGSSVVSMRFGILVKAVSTWQHNSSVGG